MFMVHNGIIERRLVRLVQGLVGSVLLILIFLWIDIREAVGTLTRTDVRVVVIIFGLACVHRYLKAYKWNLLLKTAGVGLSNAEALKIYLASGFAENFLPTGGSDLYRAYRTRLDGHSVSNVSVSIVVERIIGLGAIILSALIGLGVLIIVDSSQFLWLFYAVILTLVMFLVAVGASVHEGSVRSVKRLLERFVNDKVARRVLECHSSYREVGKHGKTLCRVLLLCIIEQGVLVLMNYCGAKALGLQVSLIYFLAVVPISSFVLLLPISVGGIGVQEGTYIVLLGLAGLSPAASVGFSVLMRVIGWLMVIPAGLVFVYDSMRMKRAENAA